MKENKFKVSLKKISIKTVKVAGISLCAVFTFILGSLAVFQYYSYSEVLQRTVKNRARLSVLEKDEKELSGSLGRFKEERGRLEKILFSDKDIASFLNKISEFANEAQVSIIDMKAQRFQNVKLSQEETVSEASLVAQKDMKKDEKEMNLTLASLPINMLIEGKFECVINFLLSLERYRQLLTLTNVEIKRKAYPILECRFTLRLYSLKQLDEIIR